MDNSSQLEYFRQQLAQYIAIKGFSYRGLSTLLGKSSNYIDNILSGKACPTMKMLLEISEMLEVEPGDFFIRTGFSDEVAEIIPKLRKLSPDELALINDLLDLRNKRKNK